MGSVALCYGLFGLYDQSRSCVHIASFKSDLFQCVLDSSKAALLTGSVHNVYGEKFLV